MELSSLPRIIENNTTITLPHNNFIKTAFLQHRSHLVSLATPWTWTIRSSIPSKVLENSPWVKSHNNYKPQDQN